MESFEMRPSPRMVRQIGLIERASGKWDRLAESEALASSALCHLSMRDNSICSFLLDSTSPVALRLRLGQWLESTQGVKGREPEEQRDFPVWLSREEEFLSFFRAHEFSFSLDVQGIWELYQLIGVKKHEQNLEGAEHRALVSYRSQGTYFTALLPEQDREDIVFPTVSPFLIEKRLNEALDWANQLLGSDNFHPLFVIGTFHLLFLQIHPFPTANHRLSLLILWHMLMKHDYSFAKYSCFSRVFHRNFSHYITALRQAEKTILTNWSTLNIWLEFFLDSLLVAITSLLEQSRRSTYEFALTGVQRDILDVIRSGGVATREGICEKTGLNVSTIKYNLSVLTEKGHLKREGGGRTTSYRLM